MYLYLKCNIKWGTQNTKFKVKTNTKMTHVMCSLWKRIFTLLPLAHLTMFSPYSIFVPHKVDRTKRNKKIMVFSPLSYLFKDMAHSFFFLNSCFLSYFCNIICICFMFFSTTHNLLFWSYLFSFSFVFSFTYICHFHTHETPSPRLYFIGKEKGMRHKSCGQPIFNNNILPTSEIGNQKLEFMNWFWRFLIATCEKTKSIYFFNWFPICGTKKPKKDY
jgi:hypothetical protein